MQRLRFAFANDVVDLIIRPITVEVAAATAGENADEENYDGFLHVLPDRAALPFYSPDCGRLLYRSREFSQPAARLLHFYSLSLW